MSGISLSHFLEVARLGTDGEVRVASGDVGNVLVNKGMIEHRLGTWLGMGDSSTRTQRNNVAIEEFRKALCRRFGTDNAEQALKLAGYTEGTPLTGQVIVDTHRHARHLEQDNIANNHRILERTEILHDDPNVVDAFAARFAENLKASTRYYRDSLTDDDLKALINTTARQVSGLGNIDRLKESDDARKALSDAMQGVLVSIANKGTPSELLARLLNARDKHKALVDIEREGDEHRDTGELDWRVALFDALTKLGTAYPAFVEDLRRTGLSDSSALRALYAAAEEVVQSTFTTDREKQEAEALKKQCETLINDIVAAGRPHTESQTGDTELLQKVDTVNKQQLGIARNAVNRMLGIGSTTISQFVDFARQGLDDEIGWVGGQLIKATPEDDVATGAALAKFLEALTGQYGERIAREALDHARQNQNGFNGHVVIEAEKHIQTLVGDTRDIYRQIVRTHHRQGDDDTVTIYNRRFKQVLEARSDGFNRSLTEGLGPDETEERAQALAMEVHEQVAKLAELGLLDSSSKARQLLSTALLDMVAAIVNRLDPDGVEGRLVLVARKKKDNFDQVKDLLDDVPETVGRQETAFLLGKLLKVDKCLSELQSVEEGTGPQTGSEKLQIAMIDAIRRFLQASGDDAFDLFDKGMLSESSPFRALYAAAREVAEDKDAPEAQRTRARALMEQWEQLATVFVAMTTPNTQTRTDNLKHLLERPVDELRLEAARIALARHLEPLSET